MADDGLTIELKGGKEVSAALRSLRDELPKNVIRSALRYSADRMRRVIIGFAPRRTARLVQAISVKTRSRGGVARAQVVVNVAGSRDDPRNAFYWRFLEKGWHSRAGIPYRREFIEPAFRTEGNDAAQSVITALETAIAKAEAKARI